MPCLLDSLIMKKSFAISLVFAASTICIAAAADERKGAADAPAAESAKARKPAAQSDRNVYEIGIKVPECECCGKSNGKGIREALFKLEGVKRVSFRARQGVAIVRMKDAKTELTKQNVTDILAKRKLVHAELKYFKPITEPKRNPRPSAEELRKEINSQG